MQSAAQCGTVSMVFGLWLLVLLPGMAAAQEDAMISVLRSNIEAGQRREGVDYSGFSIRGAKQAPGTKDLTICIRWGGSFFFKKKENRRLMQYSLVY